MNNLDIQSLLDELQEKPFLELIETLNEKESEYKKTSFYKQTKIPLALLFEKYIQHKTLQYSLKEQAKDFIEEVNFERVLDSILNWVEKPENQQKIEQVFSKLLEKFSLESLAEESEELKTLLNDFKKLT